MSNRPPGGTKAVMHKCRLPACTRMYGTPKDASGRGLCGPCYQMASRLVRLKQTSWAELETLGLADPPTRKRSATLSRFEEALAAARAAPGSTDDGPARLGTGPAAGPAAEDPPVHA